jgi:hypothetical protein
LSWDDKVFLLGQRFLRGNETIAHALARAQEDRPDRVADAIRRLAAVT